MRRLLPALALVATGGCGSSGEAGATGVVDEEQPIGGVYVARSKVPLVGPDGRPAPARMALFHGRYAVVNGCLVFAMSGAEPALVRFAPATSITVFPDRVAIDGQTHRFDRTEQRGGGFDGANAYDLLVAPPPAQCRYSVIGP